MPATDEMPDLKEPDSEGPPPEGPPEGLPSNDPAVTSIRELILDYLDIPLVGFSQLELYQVVPWICFEAQNMCKPPWCTELALIQQDEEV